MITSHLSSPALDVGIFAASKIRGHSRVRLSSFRTEQVTQEFLGLPAEFQHPKQLLEPLRHCGKALPFNRRALSLLEILFDYSNPQSWKKGARPIIFPSNLELANALGYTVRTVQLHLQALVGAGAIYIHRGVGNRRTPVRNAQGQIIACYGIDLSPMTVLALRFREQADLLKQRRHALLKERRPLMALIEKIRVAYNAELEELDSANGIKEGGQVFYPLWQEAEDINMMAQKQALQFPKVPEEAQEKILAWFKQSLDLLESKFTGLKKVMLNVRPEDRKELLLEKISREHEKFHIDNLKENTLNKISINQSDVEKFSKDFPKYINLLKEAYPGFKDIIKSYTDVGSIERLDYQNFIKISQHLALQTGISEKIWQEGCGQHGKFKACLAAILTTIKPDYLVNKSRAGFLTGLLRKPPQELNPIASLYSLAKKNNPK
jgi:replication initiation protein RepC